MKNYFLLLLLVFVMSNLTNSFGQGLDLQVGGGGITYQGELSRDKFWKDIFDLKLCGTVGLSVIPNRHFVIGLEYHRGRVYGDDLLSADSAQMVRGLNFSTLLQEVSLYGEYHFLKNADLQSDGDFSPYVSLGFSWFHFNPVATYDDRSYVLRNFGTEGQLLAGGRTKAYKNYSFSIPVGIGAKYHINSLFAVKADIKGRYAFTDYLDDVSTDYPDYTAIYNQGGQELVNLVDRRKPPTFEGARGNKKYNDGYLTYTLSLVIHILPAYRNDVFCPKIEKPDLEF